MLFFLRVEHKTSESYKVIVRYKMRKIKIAIIGCGIITEEAHLPALLWLSERIEIKAVCNRTK